MDSSKSNKFEVLFEELELFLNASIVGEKVELTVAPTSDNKSRIVTLGLQNGLSRDRKSFEISNGDLFDKEVLPIIINYYQQADPFKSNIKVDPAKVGATQKNVFETESGNLLYLETYNNKLVDNLIDNKYLFNSTFQSSLSKQALEWQAILEYAKQRRVVGDFLRLTLSSEERKRLEWFVDNFSNNKKIVLGTTKKSKDKIIKNLEILLSASEYNENIEKLGIDNQAYQFIKNNLDKSLLAKLKNTINIEHLATIMQARGKLEQFLSKNKDTLTVSPTEFKNKVNFAIEELGKTKYYEKRNASYKSFSQNNEKQNYTDNCVGEVKRLQKYYEESRNLNFKSYSSYCNELLDYLEIKAKQASARRQNIKIISSDAFEVKEYNQRVNNVDFKTNLEDLIDKIKLCKEARVDKENYEIIIKKDATNLEKRLVRVGLINGISGSDYFEFEFNNGDEFDFVGLPKIIATVTENDKIVEKNESFEKTSVNRLLVKTENGNELLIDSEIINKIPTSKKTSVDRKTNEVNSYDKKDFEELKEYLILFQEVEKRKKEQGSGKLSEIGINSLKKMEERLKELESSKKIFALYEEINNGNIKINNYDKKYLDNNSLSEIEPPNNIVVNKKDSLNVLREQIRTGLDNKEQTVSFEELKYLNEMYKFVIKGNNLAITTKKTNKEYHPKSLEEFNSVSFALYWDKVVRVNNNLDSFSEDNKRLFAIVDNNFRESIKKGLPIDFDSIKKKFLDTKYSNATLVYERLFKSSKHKEYLVNHYLKQMGISDVKSADEFLKKDSDREDKYNPVRQIREAYEIATEYSKEDKKAALRVHFPKDNDKEVEVVVSHGSGSDDSILFFERFDKEKFMREMIYDICNIYTENSSPASLKVYGDNSNKKVLIATGVNDNILQVTNASEKELQLFDLSLKNQNNPKEYKGRL